MSDLPIPAKQYFDDFAFDLEDYKIIRGGKGLCTAKGLTNSEKGRPYVSFLVGLDLRVGDVLLHGKDCLSVLDLDTDSYNGEPQIIKAYF